MARLFKHSNYQPTCLHRAAILTALTTASLLAAHSASAATITWTGASSAVWSTPGNWSGLNTPPILNDDVVFNTSVTPANVTLDVNTPFLKTLSLTSSATDGWTINASPSTNTLNLISAGSTPVLTSSGTTMNTINANIKFGTAAGADPTIESRISIASGNTLKVTGNITTSVAANSATLGVYGGGTLWLTGALSTQQTSTNDGVVIDNSTFRFDGSSATMGGGGSNGFGIFGTSTLYWNSSVDLSTLNRIVVRNATGDKMIVLNQNFSKAVGTAAGQLAYVGNVNTGSFGFSIIGGTTRTVALGTVAGQTWDTAASSSSGVLRTPTLKLNTHADANALLNWTQNLSIVNNGTQRTIEVGAANAEISGSVNTTAGVTATTLRKTGAGTLTLSNAANSFSGTYLVEAGTLAIASGASINSATGITINGATANFKYNSATSLSKPITFTQGTLSGTGTIGVAVNTGASGTISPGNSIGVLTINNTLSLAGIGYFEISPSSSDQIIGLTAIPTISGSITADFASGSYSAGTYDLITWAGGGTLGSTPTLNIVNPGNIAGFTASLVTSTAGKLILNLASAGGIAEFTPSAGTLDLGNILLNASNVSSTFLATNTGAAAGAVTSVSSTSSGFTAAGTGASISPGNDDTITVNLATNPNGSGAYGTQTTTLTVNPQDTGTKSVTVNVGNASAAISGASGNAATFTGTLLSAPVGSAIVGLASHVTANSSVAIASEAIILETNDANGLADNVISMTWRDRATDEQTPFTAIMDNENRILASDVVELSGLTGIFTVKMFYDESLFASPADEAAAVASGNLFLGHLTAGVWLNPGTSANLGAYDIGTDFALGNWGVDPTNNYVWAVVNQNGQYAAVIPEPASLCLLALGTLALATKRRRN